jgi:hypothetical protein
VVREQSGRAQPEAGSDVQSELSTHLRMHSSLLGHEGGPHGQKRGPHATAIYVLRAHGALLYVTPRPPKALIRAAPRGSSSRIVLSSKDMNACDSLPQLDFILRPSISLTASAAPLASTLPALVLPHSRLETYALQMHRRGLLYIPDLGKHSFAKNEDRRPKEALDANPALRSLYAHIRERPSAAWIFFGAPSACAAAVRRALALYVLFWHQIVRRDELIGSAAARSRAAERAADVRRRLGPSFIFFPAEANPLARHASRSGDASRRTRARRLRLLAGTLASIGDVAREDGATALDFAARHWRPIIKEIKTDKAAAPESMARSFVHIARVQRGHAANIERVLASLAPPAAEAPSYGALRCIIVTVHGHWRSVWSAPAVSISACPLPRELFYPQSRAALLGAPALTAARSHGGASRESFIRAAVQALDEARLFGAPDALRGRLLQEAADLELELSSGASREELAAAIAGRVYEAAEDAFSEADGAPPDARHGALASEDSESGAPPDARHGALASEDSESSAAPWEPVAFYSAD